MCVTEAMTTQELPMIIEQLTVGPIQENCYIVGDEQTREGFIVDPGYEASRILEVVKQLGLTITKIINTHAHVDHICAVQPLKDALAERPLLRRVPFYLHPEERMHLPELVEHAAMFGMFDVKAPTVDFDLADGDVIECGPLSIEVTHTPGHTPGHCLLRVGDDVFCGDLIFAGSIGRVDLPGGDHEAMIESLERHILTLADAVRLHPGHGESTTVALERQYNPFLRGLRAYES